MILLGSPVGRPLVNGVVRTPRIVSSPDSCFALGYPGPNLSGLPCKPSRIGPAALSLATASSPLAHPCSALLDLTHSAAASSQVGCGLGVPSYARLRRRLGLGVPPGPPLTCRLWPSASSRCTLHPDLYRPLSTLFGGSGSRPLRLRLARACAWSGHSFAVRTVRRSAGGKEFLALSAWGCAWASPGPYPSLVRVPGPWPLQGPGFAR